MRYVNSENIDNNVFINIEKKLNTLQLKNNTTTHQLARLNYNEELDLHIDLDNGVHINKDGLSYYTYPIYRKDIEKLENIVFVDKENNEELEAYLVKYDITPSEFDLLTTEDKKNLEAQYQKAVGPAEYICIDFIQSSEIYPECPYPNGQHANGVSCDPETIITTASFCVFTSSNGGGGSGDGIPYDTNPNDPGNNGNQGGYSGGSGDEDENTQEINTSPINLAPWQEIELCINGDFGTEDTDGITLSEANINWLQGQPRHILSPINDYLAQNQCSEEAQEFTVLVLEALGENEELDSEKLLKLTNGMDKECQARALFKSIFKANTNFANNIKETFFKVNSNNLNLQDIDFANNDNSAASVHPLQVDDSLILYFSNSHLETSTTLGFVISFYHELVHAMILQSYYNDTLLDDYPDYIDLKDAIDNYLDDTESIELTNIYNQEMHNIYNDFILDIAETIVAYSDINNISGVDLEYAKKLIWGSLFGYDIISENFTEIEQQERSTILSHEHLNNTENAKGSKTCN